MVEGEGAALAAAPDHELSQLFILLHDDGLVLLRQGGGIVRGADHRLHAQLGKAEIEHGLNILQKVGVGMGEGAAHIIAPVAAGPDKALELRHDALPASVAGVVHAESVMDLLPPVQGQDHVVALAVGKFDHLVVHEHAVRGQGEAEMLAGLRLDGAGVGDQVLDDLEVHQRLTAEEVHLQIPPGPGVLHQIVERALADLEGHQGAVAVIFALAGEAIGAVEIAGVGHVQAERLDDAGSLGLELSGHGLVDVGREQLARLAQGLDLSAGRLQFLQGRLVRVAVVDRGDQYVAGRGFVVLDQVIGDLVNDVD